MRQLAVASSERLVTAEGDSYASSSVIRILSSIKESVEVVSGVHGCGGSGCLVWARRRAENEVAAVRGDEPGGERSLSIPLGTGEVFEVTASDFRMLVPATFPLGLSEASIGLEADLSVEVFGILAGIEATERSTERLQCSSMLPSSASAGVRTTVAPEPKKWGREREERGPLRSRFVVDDMIGVANDEGSEGEDQEAG